MAIKRFNGNLDNVDLSDLTGGTPTPPPAPPQPPTPQPAPAPQPHDDDNNPPHGGRRQRTGWGKWVLIIAAVLVIVAIAIKWGLPALQSGQSNPDPNPSTSQGDSSQAPSNTGDNSNDQNPSDQQGSNSTPSGELNVYEQAALLDDWYKDVPQEAWVTKTMADIGATNAPIGQFAMSFAVVTEDGTVIIRGFDEQDAKSPIIISDYVVPEQLYKHVLALSTGDPDAVIVIAKVENNLRDQGSATGPVWKWDLASNGYVSLDVSGTVNANK